MYKAFLTVFIISFLGSFSSAQNLEQKVTVSFENTPLLKVLNHISNTYSIDFFYGNGQIPLKHKISFKATGTVLGVVLKELFAGLQVQYKVIDGYVVLRKDDPTVQQKPLTGVSNITYSNITAVEKQKADERMRETYLKPIPPPPIIDSSKTELDQYLSYELKELSKIEKKNVMLLSTGSYSSESILNDKSINVYLGPNLSYNHYDFNFISPENGDQSFSTEFNHSLGLTVLLETQSRFAIQLMPKYATKNFSYQYNFAVFDENDPALIPKETSVDLRYIEFFILCHYHLVEERHFRLSGSFGGSASFAARKSELTFFENNDVQEETEIFSAEITNTLASMILGIRPVYFFSSRTQLCFMPHYQYYFNRVNETIMTRNTRQWAITVELLFRI